MDNVQVNDKPMRIPVGKVVGTIVALSIASLGCEATADTIPINLQPSAATSDAQQALRLSSTNTEPTRTLPLPGNKEAKSLAPILEEIATLQDGWYGPGSRAIPRSVLNRVQRLFDLDERIENAVRVGPYGDGTVVLEWRPSNINYTAEFMRDGTIYYVEDNVDTDALYEEDLPNVYSLYRLLQGQLI